MKLHFALGTLLLFTSISGCGGESETAAAGDDYSSEGDSAIDGDSSTEGDSFPGVAKYEVDSAIIEYEIAGPSTGTETLYFDRFGARETVVNDLVVEVGSMKMETSSVTISEGAWVTKIEHASRSAERWEIPMFDEDLQVQDEAAFRDMGGVLVGTEEIAGLTCDVWEMALLETKTWSWKGVMLKTEVTNGGSTYSKTATSVQENPSIPASRFEVPDGYEVFE